MLVRCGTVFSRCRIHLQKQNLSSSRASKTKYETTEKQVHVEISEEAHSVLNVTIFVESWKLKTHAQAGKVQRLRVWEEQMAAVIQDADREDAQRICQEPSIPLTQAVEVWQELACATSSIFRRSNS